MKKIPFINKVLKDERKKKKITQSDFSKLIFKSTGTVKRYDTGDIIPESVFQRSCEILNLNFLVLLDFQDKQNKSLTKDNQIDDIYYNDLILKYKKELNHFRKQINHTEENLQCVAEKLVQLYNLFYNEYYIHIGEIIADGNTKTFIYKIIENKIIIYRQSTPFYLPASEKNSEYKEINTFSLNQGEEFISEIKNYFNFRNDILKKHNSKITIDDLLIKHF